MRIRTGPSATILLLVLVAAQPLANAGTSADPEIADPADGTPKYADIRKVWITDKSTTAFEISIELEDLAPTPGVVATSGTTRAGADIGYFVDFLPLDAAGDRITAKSATYDHSFIWIRFNATAGTDLWQFRQGMYGTTYSSKGDVAGRVEGKVLTATLNRSIAGIEVPSGEAGAGSSLSNLQGSTRLTTWRAASGGTLQDPSDTAPDTGFGRVFYFGGGPKAPAVHYAELADASALVTHSHPTKNSDRYVYNWSTEASDVALQLQATIVSGTVDVEVRDGADASVYAASLKKNESLENALEGVEPGAWQLELNYTKFVGNVSVSLVPEADEAPGGGGPGASSGPGAPSGTPSPAVGNDTNPGEDKSGGGTPAPGAVAAFAASIGAALAARRRLRR